MSCRLTWLFVVLLMAPVVPKLAQAGEAALLRSAPETQGVSSRALLAFVEAADKLAVVHSVMLVRHGHVVAEGFWAPYERDAVHEVYSVAGAVLGQALHVPGLRGSPSEVSLEWNAAERLATLTLLLGGREQPFQCRSGVWIKSRATLVDGQVMPIAASCAWTSRDTLAVRLRMYERSWHID